MSNVMRKPAFCIVKTKVQISCVVTLQLISAFVFATKIIQSTCFLNQKFPTHLQSSVIVQPGLCLTWSESLKTGFPMTWLKYKTCLSLSDLTSDWYDVLKGVRTIAYLYLFICICLSYGIRYFCPPDREF